MYVCIFTHMHKCISKLAHGYMLTCVKVSRSRKTQTDRIVLHRHPRRCFLSLCSKPSHADPKSWTLRFRVWGLYQIV